MQNLEQAQQILAEFGRTIGLEELTFDAYGYCCLGFDNVLVNMELVPQAQQLMLYAHLGLAPQPASAELYESLLEANHFFRGTGGATIGVDPATRSIALVYALPLPSLTPVLLEAEIKGFVDIAESWMTRLDQPAGGTDTSEQQGPMFQGLRV
ncbi:type III secretion system chaperone [Telmatospirillum sp. J64-1]|uniref:type III secretion system chaperone n=1 Tax=Telmatospirillum sp. J64-1 TaxID=2502183 RepID=UPI00163D3D6F|nr:type III secretion system chaperone [Telmatospirillum sp. J64-1]